MKKHNAIFGAIARLAFAAVFLPMAALDCGDGGIANATNEGWVYEREYKHGFVFKADSTFMLISDIDDNNMWTIEFTGIYSLSNGTITIEYDDVGDRLTQRYSLSGKTLILGLYTKYKRMRNLNIDSAPPVFWNYGVRKQKYREKK
jgi:hypothetical protein